MTFSKKLMLSVATGAAALAIVFSGILSQKVGAAVFDCPPGTQISGWAWSSNIGWISFSSKNPTGPGGPHCVSITADSSVVGWAWSSNIGWIKFGELTGFPASGSVDGNAKIANGKLVGWARACSGTVRSGDNPALPKYVGDCSTMTSRQDGWDGWIELSDTRSTTPTHTLSYNSTDQTFNGYMWGSEVIGWIAPYDMSTKAPVNPGKASCSLNSEDLSGGNYKLTWNSDPPATGVTSCRGIGYGFTDQVKGVAGSAVVRPQEGGTTYTLMCTTNTGEGEITCNSPRSLGGGTPPCGTPPCGGGGGGTDPTYCELHPADPACDSVGGGDDPSTSKLKIMVADTRFGMKYNTSDDYAKNIHPVARVQKGKPLILTAFVNESDFLSVTLTPSDSKVKVKQQFSASGESQSIDQSDKGVTITPVTYTLTATQDNENGLVKIHTDIIVQVVDPKLQEI